MRITKDSLASLILEEMTSLEKEAESERKKKETERKRRLARETFPGKEPLDQLSKGIYDEAKGKPLCTDKDGDKANPWKDEDGHFTSPEKAAGSWSNMPWGPHGSDCASGRKKRNSANRATQFTRLPCGRKTKEGGKAPYKCKDGSKAYQEAMIDEDDPYIKVRKSALKTLLSQELSSLIDDWENYLDETEALLEQQGESAQAVACRRLGFMSWTDFLKRQNAYVLSAKGDLEKPKKA